MSVIVEGQRAMYLGAQAYLLEEKRELAWAEKHVRLQPDVKWILGNFVEADNPNENGHIFPLAELQTAQASIAPKPLNLLHRPYHIVGAFVAAELLYPREKAAMSPAARPDDYQAPGPGETDKSYTCSKCGTDFDPEENSDCPSCGKKAEPVSTDPESAAVYASSNPHVEALSAFWNYYFPELYEDVKKAHAEGSLYYSMECVPRTVSCVDAGCNKEFAYDGRQSTTYCDHLNAPRSAKRLNKPHFTAGALIIPPVKPGWKRADITELSGLIEANLDEAGRTYDQIARDLPHLSPREWETLMLMVMQLADA